MLTSDSVQVLYADNHLLGLYKPAGLLVQGDRTGDPTLLDWARDWIRERCHKPGRVYVGLVHRLDRPVAGVVVLARTSKAARRLSEQFRTHSCRKVYHAVVRGTVEPPEGALHAHLMRQGKRTILATSGHPDARRAELHYRRLAVQGGMSLLEIELVTGRHHQIRAQLAGLGHPILGDGIYGRAGGGQGPLALLAYSLTVRHPTRPESILLAAPYPPGWPWPPLRA